MKQPSATPKQRATRFILELAAHVHQQECKEHCTMMESILESIQNTYSVNLPK